MTHAEFTKEAKDKGMVTIQKGWLILTIASFFVGIGINIGVSQTQLATKLDDKQARVIIKEELNEQLKHYGTDVDVKVLENKFETLNKQLEEINKKLDRLVGRR